MQFARVGGGVGTLYTGYNQFKSMRSRGYTVAEAGITTTLGYNPKEDKNSLMEIGTRLLGTYWPALVGELIHQGLGNPKGFFDSGFGMKLNRSTPKGMNF